MEEKRTEELQEKDLASDPFTRIMEGERPEELLESAFPFLELMSRYRCAMMEVETKLRVLDEEFSMTYNRNPFETIKSRLKKPISIIDKMRRKGMPLSVENIERTLNDIAGVRVICSFPDDIYALAAMLVKQDDIKLIEKKDYIAHPKPNGYRSLHLIVEVPIFLSNCKKYMRVEVQFRTIAMDFWASLDHQLKYKKDLRDDSEISQELKQCADVIAQTDAKMLAIRQKIEAQGIAVRKE